MNSKKQQRKWVSRFTQDKTKILSSESSMNPDTRRYMKIGDMDIEILAKSESVKYLGQRISFYQQETIEIKSRIRAAWTTFRKYRQELTSKKYMLKLRLRLFDATVSPTLCYASGTWSPSREHERMIQSTQRKMLRLIIQTKRKYKKIEKKKKKLSNTRLKKEMTTKLKTVALMTKAATTRAPNLKMIWTAE